MHPYAGKTIDDFVATLWTGRQVTMKAYKAAVKAAKAEPQRTWSVGWGENEVTGEEFIAKFRQVLDQTICKRGSQPNAKGRRDYFDYFARTKSEPCKCKGVAMAERVKRRITQRVIDPLYQAFCQEHPDPVYDDELGRSLRDMTFQQHVAAPVWERYNHAAPALYNHR